MTAVGGFLVCASPAGENGAHTKRVGENCVRTIVILAYAAYKGLFMPLGVAKARPIGHDASFCAPRCPALRRFSCVRFVSAHLSPNAVVSVRLSPICFVSASISPMSFCFARRWSRRWRPRCQAVQFLRLVDMLSAKAGRACVSRCFDIESQLGRSNGVQNSIFRHLRVVLATNFILPARRAFNRMPCGRRSSCACRCVDRVSPAASMTFLRALLRYNKSICGGATSRRFAPIFSPRSVDACSTTCPID